MAHDRSRPISQAAAPQRRDLYPQIEPYQAEMLPVDGRHTLYLEQCGTPEGLPVLCLHGGPGGGASPEMRRFFDPKRCRMVLFDQRGCGRSTPYAALEDNTTWDLVADIERIRERLGIERWLVFGGSWGSTLALAYAVTHPDRCAGLLLRGVFLLTEAEIRWFYQDGASHLFPDAFERFQAPIPLQERGDFVSAFYRRLTSSSRTERIAAARAWGRWEGETISFLGPAAMPSRFNDDRFIEAFARIECHYFKHKGFFDTDGWLLQQVGAIRHLPGVIVHGRYDVCTPLSSAWKLKQAWPEAELEIVGDAGHSSLESGIVDALIRASERFVAKGSWL
ncbi:MAG: prolyl aminopeptidase [Alphaproteobacteria bacterium]|nr:prolyl aminopeptidase [Alphaproteobacteria bacterium]